MQGAPAAIGYLGRLNCSIIVAPLLRSRIPTVCDGVVTVTTHRGKCVDVLVTIMA